MLLRLPVIVSALAFALAFVAAPHEHLHRDTGIQHAHVTSHVNGDHQGDVPDGPDHGDRGAGIILSTTSFVTSGAVHVLTVDRAEGPPVPVIRPDTETAESIAGPEPRTHGPPVESALTPRPPPSSPAF